MKFIEYYAIEEHDGFVGTNHVADFATDKAAREFLDKKGNQSYNFSGPFRRNLKLYDSYEDYYDNNDKAIRQRAIAKLTPEERAVLKLE